MIYFGKENPGNGKSEDASKYIYKFEDIVVKNDVYNLMIKRPASLHWGFDFVIYLNKNNEYYDFCNINNLNQNGKKRKKNSPPGMSDIIILLNQKKNNNEEEFKKVLELIEKIYQCKKVDIHYECQYINFKDKCENDLPIEVILKLTKWLFIEQDIRYWNYSGRKSFYEYIKENLN